MILEVITYPNPLLKKRSEDVTEFDTSLHTLLDNMNETMIASHGIGLAAIQVAKPLRALIINIPNEEDLQDSSTLLELINPVITNEVGTVYHQEGCLSIPGFYEDVKRAAEVTVSYQDRFGNPQTLEATELLAIAVQHEMDHLEGRLFIDTFSFIKRKKFEKEWKKKLKGKS
jgi:peptide deformylase